MIFYRRYRLLNPHLHKRAIFYFIYCTWYNTPSCLLNIARLAILHVLDRDSCNNLSTVTANDKYGRKVAFAKYTSFPMSSLRYVFHLPLFFCTAWTSILALHSNPSELRQDLRPSYWIWLASFICIDIAITLCYLWNRSFRHLFLILLVASKSFIWNWFINSFLVLHNSLMSLDVISKSSKQ